MPDDSDTPQFDSTLMDRIVDAANDVKRKPARPVSFMGAVNVIMTSGRTDLLTNSEGRVVGFFHIPHKKPGARRYGYGHYAHEKVAKHDKRRDRKRARKALWTWINGSRDMTIAPQHLAQLLTRAHNTQEREFVASALVTRGGLVSRLTGDRVDDNPIPSSGHRVFDAFLRGRLHIGDRARAMEKIAVFGEAKSFGDDVVVAVDARGHIVSATLASPERRSMQQRRQLDEAARELSPFDTDEESGG